MNKINYLTFSGLLMALAGVTMLTSETIGVDIAKIAVPVFFLLGGIFAYLFSAANKQHRIARQYHLLQGFGMMTFAVIIALVPQNLGDFLKYITYFMLLFGLLELLFGFLALNTGNQLNMNILLSRFVAGFVNIIGAVLILATAVTDEISGLMIAGVLILLGGIAFVLFSFRVKKMSESV
ncbi:MAG: hypothetical protein AAGG68_23420 [Bacteroidota bacterium]